MKITRLALSTVAAFAAAVPAAYAEVSAITINSSSSAGVFANVPYMRLEGEIRGQLRPNEPIPDLERATRNADGKVEYKTRFVIIAPQNPKQGNGALLFDVPNRGRPISHAFYNSPRSRPLAVGSLDEGLGFLQTHGYAIVAPQWELGQGFEPPTFVDEKGATRYVEGVAFAAMRDIALFLRDNRASSNPLAGAIRRTYATGYSQTGRFLKTFLTHGFNTYGGKQVFEGLHIVGAGAGQIPLLQSGTGPQSVASSTPNPGNPEHRGVHEEPFAYDQVIAAMQQRKETIPKIIVAHYQNDYLGSRASLTRTGAESTSERIIPSEVRMYDITGAGHLNVRTQDKACKEPHAQLDWSAPLRAQLVALDQWITKRREPPANTLMTLRAPGPDDELFAGPKYLPKATVLIPVFDSDGNAIGGVRMPDVEVPLGTHGRLNSPVTNTNCRLAGAYRPFARTKQERIESNDPRPSLEERYPGGSSEYTNRVRQAADRLVAQRHLLKEDAAVIINVSAEEPLIPPTPVAPLFR